MNKDELIVSVDEARKILGTDAEGLTDEEIITVISTLDILAKDALETVRTKLRMKKDAKALAELIYDIYQEKKSSKSNSDKKNK